MKRKAANFPWKTVLLTACAIGMGVGFNFLLQTFLPSYKNTVVTVSDVPTINQLLYVEDTDELIIFPWDRFSQEDCLSVSEYLDTQENLPQEEYRKYMLQASEEINALMKHLLDAYNRSPSREIDWQKYLLVEPEKGNLYIKGVRYPGATGEEYVVDAAWEDGFRYSIFFHVYKAEPDILLDSTIEAANRYLDRIFAFHWQVEKDIPQSILPEPIPTPDPEVDPIWMWLHNIGGHGLQESLLVELLSGRSCDRIVYRDEILLVYYLDGLGARVVLFYDPLLYQITGFSLNL